MEDWRVKQDRKSDKVLLQVARQRIWLHWVMWFFPIVSWVTCFVSAALIRSVKPIAIGLGTSMAFGIIAGLAGDQSGTLIFTGALIGSAIGAGLTQVEIQNARDEIDARRR